MTWQRVPLKEIGKWYGGGTPSKSNASYWNNGTIPWLSPKDMGPEVLSSTQDRVTPRALDGSAARLVPAGSVAVVTRSGILERTIPVGLVPFETTLNQDMKAVVPRAGIDPRWVAWGLRAFESQLLRETRKAGTTVASIEMPRFHAFRLPVPPYDEQRHILDLLEDQLSRIDKADSLLRAGIHRVKALGNAHLRNAFSESLGPLRPLLEVASIANGQTPKGVVESLTAVEGEGAFPFYKVGDMNSTNGRWMDHARFFVPHAAVTSLGLHIRPAGTVLIPKRGGAIATNKKRILAQPAAYDLNTMGLIPSVSLDSSYLWHWLQTVDLGRIADGSNVPQINARQIEVLRLPVPGLDDQRRLANRLDETREQLLRLTLDLESARIRGAAMRRALLHAAFSGDSANSHLRQSPSDRRYDS